MPATKIFFFSACLLVSLQTDKAFAQHISVDGRFSPAQTLAGPNYGITPELGKQVGGNLFHSFGNFGLTTGESATFSGPANVSNIVGRVTGGTASSINGAINSNIAGANLYLINPSGVVFGPNARVNVSGSFHASSADYLKMSDGARFQATNPDGSTLSAAPPAAFGFLNAQPAAITVNGSTLAVPAPGTLGLVGGPPVSIIGATLSAPSGTIHVTGVAGPGEVPTNPRDTAALTVKSFAPVSITASNSARSLLTASAGTAANGGGSVFIRSGALTIDASTIAANNSSSGPGGQLVLEGGSQLTLSDASSVQASALAANSGQPGLSIHAGTVAIDASTIAATNAGSAPGSQLVLQGDQAITISDNSVLQAVAAGNGNGPGLTIATGSGGNIRVDTGSNITLGTAGSGAGGPLNVQTGQLTIGNGAFLRTLTQASGNGGGIAVAASTMLLDGGSVLNQATTQATGIFSTTSSTAAGAGGAIAIVAGQLTIQNGANVLAQSFGRGQGGAISAVVNGPISVTSGASLGTLVNPGASGNAGNVSVTASGPVSVDMTIDVQNSFLDGIGSKTSGAGNAGNVTAEAKASLSLANDGDLSSTTQSGAIGNSGSVSVSVTGMLSINGSGGIPFTRTGILGDTHSSGRGGDVTVSADSIAIEGFGYIASDATYSGHGGNVVITADSMTIGGAGQISSSAYDKGDSGSIAVSVNRGLTIDGAATPGIATGVFSQANSGSTGSAGTVSVAAGNISILNAGQISTGTFGPGNGGSLSVTVGGAVTIDGVLTPGLPTGIFSQATQGSTGNAGSINVTGPSISLANFGQISNNTAGSGNAGPINVAADALSIASNGRIVSAVQSGSSGKGGDIAVSVKGQLSLDGSFGDQTSPTGISTQSQGSGSAGSVTVDAGSLSIAHISEISTDTFASGKAGNVAVSVNGPLTIDGSGTNPDIVATGIVTNSEAGSAGDAGNINVATGALSLVNGGVISSALRPFMNLPPSTGNAGAVSVNVGGVASISGEGSRIGTETTPGSTGRGGTIFVSAPQLVLTDNGEITSSSSGAGPGGTVTIDAGSLTVSAGGQIASSTAGTGKGGDVDATTTGDVTLSGVAANGSRSQITAAALQGSSGAAGQIVLTSGGTITLSGGAEVTSSTAGAGDGGSVLLSSQGALTVTDPGSGILALASATARGNGGSVNVRAPQITLLTGGAIASTTAGTGAGGAVSVSAPAALVLNGGGDPNTEIAASATGPQSGSGGTVTVAAGSLTVEGGAQIASSTAGPGKGGDVEITVASDIILPDRGPQITAQSTGSGDAGSITLSATRLLLNKGAAVSTEAETSTANGGNITLSVADFLYLIGSEITTSVKGETGNGGNITIDPAYAILASSSIIAQAIAGHGGNITINAGTFIPSTDSIVSASSQLGISGTVVINGPLVDLNGTLVVLSSELRDAAALTRSSCAARTNRFESSLVEAGRGGLPQDPQASLPALYIAGRELGAKTRTTAGAPVPAMHTTIELTMACGAG